MSLYFKRSPRLDYCLVPDARKLRSETKTPIGGTAWRSPGVRLLHLGCFLCLAAMCVQSRIEAAAGQTESLALRISWGHHSPQTRPYVVRLAGAGVSLSDLVLDQAEAGDQLTGLNARTTAGGGDADQLQCKLTFTGRTIHSITNAHSLWRYLLDHTEPGAARRLQADPAWRPDPRRLEIQLDDSGLRGFCLTVDQLRQQKTFWFPEFDVFVSAGENPYELKDYKESLKGAGGSRILDRVKQEPEATYASFTNRWEDMGSLAYQNPHSVPPGHIVGLTWDSALYKFGIDRLAEVRNDYAKQDVFHFRFALAKPRESWRGQKLGNGLPVITTTFEEDGVRYEVEQFAFPLLGVPKKRRGDIAMVLFQKLTVSETEGKARDLSVPVELTRKLASVPTLQEDSGVFLLETQAESCLAVRGTDLRVQVESAGSEKKRVWLTFSLPANGRREISVNLPSPTVPRTQRSQFLALEYASARAATIRFWEDYLARGASFRVPDEAVNILFRANLWHALRLPRRHGGEGIDLPYSNFAYDQKGTPWPVNQSVYVDYMLYDLRGYHDLSAEELAAMYRNNQEANGHVGGFANWGVYTPSMLYVVAQHYLLSRDRSSFERLLPQTLRALDWCLTQIKHGGDAQIPTPGLMLAPLNDLTHEPRSWAFNQAYFVAGFDLLGHALKEIDHPRAKECQAAAVQLRQAVEREFARACTRSPAVQLADGSWSLYVPTDAQASGRLMQMWYPTDVDVGPLHLPRLKAIDPQGWLSTAMLHDHEDNLLIKQWGAINEPVYNPQGTVYLFRDEPKAAIRTFYSTMACAFSHSLFEPVEHRWGWGQYFGPPSTDGAWFELYRNMMIREEEDTLLLAQATPRAWLEEGREIEVRQAPTYFGPASFRLRGGLRQITATVDLSDRKLPSALVVRLRHPTGAAMQSATVNGEAWTKLDAAKEWVRISKPSGTRYTIVAQY